MTVETDDSMMTIAEVRSRLRVSASTIRRLVREEKLPAYRVGAQLRFKPEEIAAYINEQRVNKSARSAHE